MNSMVKSIMENYDLKPEEKFEILLNYTNGKYFFTESGSLKREVGKGYEDVSLRILGCLVRGAQINKVKEKPKGRYIPKNGEIFWYIDSGGDVSFCTRYFQVEYFVKHNLVFRTKEEAEDYKWFLDKLDEYKRDFVFGEENYRLELVRIGTEIEVTTFWSDENQESCPYFGDAYNVLDFVHAVGEDRIKKYMFGIYE